MIESLEAQRLRCRLRGRGHRGRGLLDDLAESRAARRRLPDRRRRRRRAQLRRAQGRDRGHDGRRGARGRGRRERPHQDREGAGRRQRAGQGRHPALVHVLELRRALPVRRGPQQGPHGHHRPGDVVHLHRPERHVAGLQPSAASITPDGGDAAIGGNKIRDTDAGAGAQYMYHRALVLLRGADARCSRTRSPCASRMPTARSTRPRRSNGRARRCRRGSPGSRRTSSRSTWTRPRSTTGWTSSPGTTGTSCRPSTSPIRRPATSVRRTSSSKARRSARAPRRACSRTRRRGRRREHRVPFARGPAVLEGPRPRRRQQHHRRAQGPGGRHRQRAAVDHGDRRRVGGGRPGRYQRRRRLRPDSGAGQGHHGQPGDGRRRRGHHDRQAGRRRHQRAPGRPGARDRVHVRQQRRRRRRGADPVAELQLPARDEQHGADVHEHPGAAARRHPRWHGLLDRQRHGHPADARPHRLPPRHARPVPAEGVPDRQGPLQQRGRRLPVLPAARA